MVEPGVVLQHGILRLAKVGKKIRDEPVEHLNGVGPGDSKPKIFQFTEVAGKELSNLVHNLHRNRIARKLNVLRSE